MNPRKKKVFCLSIVLIVIISFSPVGSHAIETSGYIPDDTSRIVDDYYNDGSFSGYVPDDEQRLTGEDEDTEPTSSTESVPVKLTNEQKQDISEMIDIAKWYTTNDSVGNPIAPPYDEAYTTEMGGCSDRIMDYGNLLLYDMGNLEQFRTVNSDYARLKALLDDPIINPQFAAYTCYLSFKENNYNNWYLDDEWQQFVEYRSALKKELTDINDDYLHIDLNALTYNQKKRITTAFFNLLELYDKMTLDNALLGDVNGDGYVTIFDVTEIQRNLVEMNEFTEGQKLRASTYANAAKNGPDYDINSATILQKFLVDKGCDEFYTIQAYNFPSKEIRPTHKCYPNPEITNQPQYKNVSIWNPIICITDYNDARLVEIESQKENF